MAVCVGPFGDAADKDIAREGGTREERQKDKEMRTGWKWKKHAKDRRDRDKSY